MSQSENNQNKSKRGGYREGSGRKPGSCNEKTREIANKAIEEGLTPLEYLLSVMRDEAQDQRERLDAAKAAAPYVHPKLSSMMHQGDPDFPIAHAVRVEFVN